MITIRPETPADVTVIHDLTLAAFAPMAFSKGNEADCLAALRRDGDLTLSLVAVENGEILGHVAFSPVMIDDNHNGWFGLGPISVLPDRQRQGIGGKLITGGLAQLEAMGAKGCALIGNPKVYSAFGFKSGGLAYRQVPAHIVQWCAMDGSTPKGTLRFSPGLEV